MQCQAYAFKTIYLRGFNAAALITAIARAASAKDEQIQHKSSALPNANQARLTAPRRLPLPHASPSRRQPLQGVSPTPASWTRHCGNEIHVVIVAALAATSAIFMSAF